MIQFKGQVNWVFEAKPTMEIVHHFGLKISRDIDAQAFSDLGIQLERGRQHLPGSSIAGFDISEDDPRWLEAQQLAETFKITDFVKTRFSEIELDAARALCMLASSNRGYPEPTERLFRSYL